MPANLTGNPSTYHTQITVPEPGDDRTAASVRGAFQNLLDNDASLKQRADALDNTARTWTQPQTHNASARFDGGIKLGVDGSEISYRLTTTRKVLLPLVPLIVPSGWVCSPDPSPQWACGSTLNALPFLIGPNVLRTGGYLTRVRAAVNTSIEVRLVVHRISYDTTDAGGAGTEGAELYATFTPSGAQVKVLDLQFSAAINNAASLFRLMIKPMVSSPSLALRWIELTFDDPGPRNF